MKLRTFVFFSLLPLFACLLWPGQAKAQDNQRCEGQATHCTIASVGSGGTVVILFQPAANNCALPTDDNSDTYHILVTAVGGGTGCYTTTNSFGVTVLQGIAYTNPGTHSGPLVVTGNANTNQISAHFFPSTDVINSGNPLDKFCTFTGTLAAGGSTYAVNPCGAGTLQSTQTNDVFYYLILVDVAASCGFTLVGAPSNGPSVSAGGGLGGCTTAFVNYSSITGAQQPSGAPQTVSLSMSGASNSSGSNANVNAFLVTLKSGVSTSPTNCIFVICKYHPPKRREPILVADIPPVWLRPQYSDFSGIPPLWFRRRNSWELA
jgi:hypothetical protein